MSPQMMQPKKTWQLLHVHSLIIVNFRRLTNLHTIATTIFNVLVVGAGMDGASGNDAWEGWKYQ